MKYIHLAINPQSAKCYSLACIILGTNLARFCANWKNIRYQDHLKKQIGIKRDNKSCNLCAKWKNIRCQDPLKKQIGSKRDTHEMSTSKLGLGFKTSLFRNWDLTIKSNIKIN
jgi:hypothetical protein